VKPLWKQYDGIDTSIAPSPDAPSIVTAYEALGLGVFGGSGSLAVSSLITSVLKSIPVQVNSSSCLLLVLLLMFCRSIVMGL
jgi:uncharacterized protein (UPF0210 family)